MHALVQSILYNQYLIIHEHYMLVNKMCVSVKRYWYFIHGTVLLLEYCGITNSLV